MVVMKRQASLLFAALAATMFVAGCTSSTGTTSDGEGRVVFGVTDAAADMESVSDLRVTIDRVRVHSESRGWVTVSSESQTYDLLELRASGELAALADINLSNGTYQQLRLDISDVVVVDGEGEHDAKLPSGTMRINAQLLVNSGETSTATFDFQADESLHVTGNGTYILAPVVQVQTRSSAQVSVDANSRVQVSGGSVGADVTVGMNEQGQVGANMRIPADAELSVGAGGGVSIGSGNGGSANGSASAGANVSVG